MIVFPNSDAGVIQMVTGKWAIADHDTWHTVCRRSKSQKQRWPYLISGVQSVGFKIQNYFIISFEDIQATETKMVLPDT